MKDDANDRDWLELRRDFGEVLDALAYSVEAAPPPHLKKLVLDRIASEGPPRPAPLPPGARAVLPGVTAVLVADAAWIPTPLPGLEYKLLHRDDARGYTTRLLRFAPGATYPAHRHGGTEEVFVVAGSVALNGVMLRAGDYCRSDAGTTETAAFSAEGGMAIIVSSDADEFVRAESEPGA